MDNLEKAVEVSHEKSITKDNANPAVAVGSGSFTKDERAPVAELKIVGLRSLPETLRDKYLDQAYQIYEASFPNPDERISRAGFERYVTDPERVGYDIMVALNGDEVVAASNHRVIDLDDIKVGYQSYIYTRADKQKQGIGKCLFEEVINSMRAQGARAMFGEMNDPFVMTADEIALDTATSMDPLMRRAMWKGMGRLALDAPYIQLGFEGGAAVKSMLLNFMPFSEDFKGISGAQYIKLLDRFFERFIPNHKADKDYQSLVAWAEKQDFIPLIELDQKRTSV